MQNPIYIIRLVHMFPGLHPGYVTGDAPVFIPIDEQVSPKIYPSRIGFPEEECVILVPWQGAMTRNSQSIARNRNTATERGGRAISGKPIRDGYSTPPRPVAALRRLQNKPLLTIDGDTGETFGGLAAAIKAKIVPTISLHFHHPWRSDAGRQHRYRVQDLWLASQAIQHGYRLLTRNQRDFMDVPGLDLVVI